MASARHFTYCSGGAAGAELSSKELWTTLKLRPAFIKSSLRLGDFDAKINGNVSAGVRIIFLISDHGLINKNKESQMKSFWIIGGGKFGLKAAEAAKKKYSDADITIIDKNSEVCRRVARRGFKFVCMEGIRFLSADLKPGGFPDWIIPVIPVHVAYEWILIQLSEEYLVEPRAVPEEIAASLPNPLRGKDGALYISFADFICPDNCPEPAKICTYTGKPRLGILHQNMASIRVEGFRSVVIQSRQLSPGVGGYPPGDLYAALQKIKEAEGVCLLGTACRCHGVMHAFTIKRVG